MVEAKNSGYPSPSYSCFFKEAVLFTPVTDHAQQPRAIPQSLLTRDDQYPGCPGVDGEEEEKKTTTLVGPFSYSCPFPANFALGVVELWEASSHATWPPGVCTESSRERDEAAVRRLQA